MSNGKKTFIQDLLLISASIIIAWLLVRTEVIPQLFTKTQDLEILAAFIAGILFTSVFTTAPALVALAELSQESSILLIAVVGSIGSVTGDILIFRFVRDRLSEHLSDALAKRTGGERIRSLMKFKLFRWMTIMIGGLIIASPIPDEVGITLLGFSKLKTKNFIPFSFVFNFIGIFIICWIARSSL